MSAPRPLLFGLVLEPKYVYNLGSQPKAYVVLTPVSGTGLAEVTSADEATVRDLEAGGSHPNVLWEAWPAGTSAVAATGVVAAPWTCIRITATNCRANVAGGE